MGFVSRALRAKKMKKKQKAGILVGLGLDYGAEFGVLRSLFMVPSELIVRFLLACPGVFILNVLIFF